MTNKSNFEEPSTEWMIDASCKGMGHEYFFPIELKGRVAAGKILAAKAICAQCVVQQECLNYALNTNQKFGIWGGQTEPERSNSLQITKDKKPA